MAASTTGELPRFPLLEIAQAEEPSTDPFKHLGPPHPLDCGFASLSSWMVSLVLLELFPFPELTGCIGMPQKGACLRSESALAVSIRLLLN